MTNEPANAMLAEAEAARERAWGKALEMVQAAAQAQEKLTPAQALAVSDKEGAAALERTKAVWAAVVAKMRAVVDAGAGAEEWAAVAKAEGGRAMESSAAAQKVAKEWLAAMTVRGRKVARALEKTRGPMAEAEAAQKRLNAWVALPAPVGVGALEKELPKYNALLKKAQAAVEKAQAWGEEVEKVQAAVEKAQAVVEKALAAAAAWTDAAKAWLAVAESWREVAAVERLAMKTLWDDIFPVACAAIEESDYTRLDKDIALAVVSAGVDLAGKVHAKFSDAYPQELTLEGVLPFAQVFVTVMTSKWVRRYCDRDAQLDRAAIWLRLTRDLSMLFGTYSVELHDEARLVDIQCNALIDAQSRGGNWTGYSFAELTIIMWLAARSFRTGPVDRLVASAVPAASTADLMNNTNIEPFSRDGSTLGELQDLLMATEAGMWAFFNALQAEHQKNDQD
jgi:hypothetical protein